MGSSSAPIGRIPTAKNVGVRGDYATWRESLATGVAVATLADIEWIAKNPRGAFKVLAEGAGNVGDSAAQSLPELSITLETAAFENSLQTRYGRAAPLGRHLSDVL